MEKSPDAFRNISEVADDLDLPQHVLRFWETRFTQIRPLKRGGGRRYYRPEDVDLLRAIRHLLYDEGYTIKGVQRILKDHGARAVAQMALTQMGAVAPRPASVDVTPVEAAREADHPAPPPRDRAEADFFESEAMDLAQSAPRQPAANLARSPAPRSALDAARDAMRPMERVQPPPTPQSPPPAPRPPTPEARREPVLDFDLPPVGSARARPSTTPGPHVAEIVSPLKSQEIERLKAVLYELAECERLLASARRA